MTSPLERKISYAQMDDFQAKNQLVKPLVDSGLDQPFGLAYHPETRSLYVADYGLRKIVRYGLRVQPCEACADGLDWEVLVSEPQKTIVTDVQARWLAVDGDGNLYFTEEHKHTVSRLDIKALGDIFGGYMEAEKLQHVGFSQAKSITESGSDTDVIVDLFTATSTASTGADAQDKLVNGPAGLSVDGAGNVIWGNAESIAYGVSHAPGNSSRLPRPTILVHDTEAPSDVCYTASMVLFTSQEKSLFGICNGLRRVTLLSDAFKLPRSVVWDGDNTAYVADHGANRVFSVATGRCRPHIVKRLAVDFRGVYGLAVIKATETAEEAE